MGQLKGHREEYDIYFLHCPIEFIRGLHSLLSRKDPATKTSGDQKEIQ